LLVSQHSERDNHVRESDNLLSGKQLGMKLIINYEMFVGKKREKILKYQSKLSKDDGFIYRL
jgi:hypothetical protein